MRKHHLLVLIKALAGVALIVSGTGFSLAAQTINADSMGLSKGSVFDTPTPKVYHYSKVQPGESKLLPRAYSGAPPQIPHDISDFLPITRDSNMCLACHNQPGQWGKKRDKGMATPIPPSHYTDLRNAPGKVTENLINARFNCNQCHVPQADAPALVENTFSAKRAR
jgi:nitrate reductase (cytochrome), electron transfer subunit